MSEQEQEQEQPIYVIGVGDAAGHVLNELIDGDEKVRKEFTKQMLVLIFTEKVNFHNQKISEAVENGKIAFIKQLLEKPEIIELLKDILGLNATFSHPKVNP